MSAWQPPDLELHLTGWLRVRLPQARVGNKTPGDLTTPLEKPLVTISEASGSKSSAVTFRRSLTVMVRAGTRTDDKPSSDLARRVFALLTSQDVVDEPGSPIAAVVDDSCFGPYPVADDLDVSARMMTVEYSVVGEPV